MRYALLIFPLLSLNILYANEPEVEKSSLKRGNWLRSSHEDESRREEVRFLQAGIYYLINCDHAKYTFDPEKHPEVYDSTNSSKFRYTASKEKCIVIMVPKSAYQTCGVAFARQGADLKQQGNWHYFLFSGNELLKKNIKEITIKS